MIYRNLAELDLEISGCKPLPRPSNVLLTTPTHFDVQYVINPHMEGKAGTVDHDRAEAQWEKLRQTYASLGFNVSMVEGAEGLLDMVFCANQTLPFLNPVDETRGVILSKMFAEQRKAEVPHFADFFEERGYEVLNLPEEMDQPFEGMGDAIWHPGRYLLWGGYGFRTGKEAYRRVSELLQVPIITLPLSDSAFYHLDTCFSILDERSVLIHSEAFDDEGRALIHHLFDHVIDTPPDEARELFACNAHCPDGEHVLIQRGCEVTSARLREAGFSPIELETDEFLKAGGSVFCMKLMYW